MNKLLSAFFLIILCSISVFAQKTATKTVKKATKPIAAPQVPEIQGHCLDLISMDSVKFFLYLDDVLQNDIAQAHVEVCNLMNDSYEAKIVLGSNPQTTCTKTLHLKGCLKKINRENDIWGHFGLCVNYDRRSGKYCILKTTRFYESLESKLKSENKTK